MDIILGKVICLVVDLVNTYISLVLGTGSGRSPFFVNIKIYTYYAKKHEKIRVFISVYEPSYRPVAEKRAIPHLAALQSNPQQF